MSFAVIISECNFLLILIQNQACLIIECLYIYKLLTTTFGIRALSIWWMPKYMPRVSVMETNIIKKNTVSLNYPMLTKSMAWSLNMKVFTESHGVRTTVESKNPKAGIKERTYNIALASIYQRIPEDVLLSIQ